MRTIVNPEDVNRVKAVTMWNDSEMPMITLAKRFDISHLVRYCRRKKIRLNAALCWCVGKAASQMKEFYILPYKGKLYQYDCIGIGPAIKDKNGDLAFCHLLYQEDFAAFYQQYLDDTTKVQMTGQDIRHDEEMMLIGTSAILATELESLCSQYYSTFTNPEVMWGRYHRHWWKYILPISLKVHHIQMDGLPAARFLEQLQKEFNSFK